MYSYTYYLNAWKGTSSSGAAHVTSAEIYDARTSVVAFGSVSTAGSGSAEKWHLVSPRANSVYYELVPESGRIYNSNNGGNIQYSVAFGFSFGDALRFGADLAT